MEDQQILYLEPYKGRAKRVLLTEKGKEYVKQTAGRLFEVERGAFKSWTKDEIDLHVSLLEKYVDSIQQQIQELGDYEI